MNKQSKEIDDIINACDPEIADRMKQIRNTICMKAPEAEEKISWGMPTFYLEGNLVHFAENKNHIGLYPGPSVIEAFKERLSDYKTSKGAIQFAHNQPLPLQLIADIVAFRVEENKQIALKRKSKRKCKMGHVYYISEESHNCPECLKLGVE